MAGPKVAKKLADVVSEVASAAKNSTKAEKILANIDTAEKAMALKGAEREAYLKALDEVHGPREQRAKDMGFGDETYYHGTASDFEKFDNKQLGKVTGSGKTKGQHWFSDNPEVADVFGDQAKFGEAARKARKFELSMSWTKLPKEVRELRPYDLDWARKKGFLKDEHIPLLEQKWAHEKAPRQALKSQELGDNEAITYPVKLRKEGIPEIDADGKTWYDSIDKIGSQQIIAKRLREGMGDFPEGTSAGITEPSRIRSTNAAFDPRFKDSPLLLAGAAAMPMTMPKEYDPAEVAKSAYNTYDKYVQEPVSKASEYIVNKLIDAQSPDKESAQRLKDSGAAGATKMILEGIADPTNLLAAPLAGGLKLSKRFRQSKEGQAILQKIAKGAAGEGIMFAPGMAQDSKFGVKEIISNQINAQEAMNAQKQALETAKNAVRVDDLHTAAALPTTGLIKPTDVVPKK